MSRITVKEATNLIENGDLKELGEEANKIKKKYAPKRHNNFYCR